MGKTIILLLVLSSTVSVFGQTKTFYENILGSSCWDCFIALNIKSESFSGRVVVENAELFNYLKDTENLNEKKYKTFISELIKNNRALKMTGIKKDDSGNFLIGNKIQNRTFRVIIASKNFETIAAKGCDDLLDHYFSILLKNKLQEKSDCRERIKLNGDDLLMYPKFDLIEQNNVIAKLFELEIPVNLDDISGSLKIAHSRIN